MVSILPATQRSNFDSCAKKLLKHSIEKPILLNFVSLSTIFCSMLSQKTYFHFLHGSDPFGFTFQKYFKRLDALRMDI